MSKFRCPFCGSTAKKHSDEDCDLASGVGHEQDLEDEQGRAEDDEPEY